MHWQLMSPLQDEREREREMQVHEYLDWSFCWICTWNKICYIICQSTDKSKLKDALTSRNYYPMVSIVSTTLAKVKILHYSAPPKVRHTRFSILQARLRAKGKERHSSFNGKWNDDKLLIESFHIVIKVILFLYYLFSLDRNSCPLWKQKIGGLAQDTYSTWWSTETGW